ncbi:MAG: hypothetical protein HC802_07965 [Caldilineaceae bacterium]|nr:hypothetical protein [Caldilineaceae bacterium]
MRILRVIVPAILTLGLWVGFSAQDASAAGQDEVGIHCQDGTCALEIGLGGAQVPAIASVGASMIFEAVQENVDFLPEGSGIELSDRLVLKMPVGDMELINAELILEPGEEGGFESVRGKAQLPLPTFGLLGDAQMITPAVADVGLDRGANLMHLGAPLDPERSYLFFNFGAGLEMSAPVEIAGQQQEIAISIPQGQNATLIIDPQSPFVFLSGDISISYSDQIAFVGELLQPAGSMLSLPDQLPFGHRVTLHVEGAFSDNLDQSYLEVGGGYGVNGGIVGRWLGFEIEPISAHGQMTLKNDGLLLTGVAGSSIHPSRLLDSQVHAQAYVPFSAGVEDAYVEVGANGSVPMLGLHADGSARLDGGMNLAANGSVETPFTRDETALAANIETLETENAGVIATLSAMTSSALDQASSGYDRVGNAAGAGASWIGGAVNNGLCGFGLRNCETDAAAEAAPEAVAEAQPASD